jgi:competence protein ComEA
MRKVTAVVVLALACAPAWAQQPAKPDTRSDALRTESVKAAPSNVRLNLNKASAAELAKLPGVGDAGAKAILKGRPYKSKEELLRKKVVPANVYEGIKANVYAGT